MKCPAAVSCSKSTVEIPEQSVKYAQSYQAICSIQITKTSANKSVEPLLGKCILLGFNSSFHNYVLAF